MMHGTMKLKFCAQFVSSYSKENTFRVIYKDQWVIIVCGKKIIVGCINHMKHIN